MQDLMECAQEADFVELEGPSLRLISEDADILAKSVGAALDPDHKGVRAGSAVGSLLGGLLAKLTFPGTTAIGAAVGAHVGGSVERYIRSLGDEDAQSAEGEAELLDQAA